MKYDPRSPQRSHRRVPPEEKAALASWLNEQEMDEWDRQMQQDFFEGGRGARIVESVKAEIRAGKFRPLGSKPK
jgi:hypothetical protein